jgi:hypothetical protein
VLPSGRAYRLLAVWCRTPLIQFSADNITDAEVFVGRLPVRDLAFAGVIRDLMALRAKHRSGLACGVDTINVHRECCESRCLWNILILPACE